MSNTDNRWVRAANERAGKEAFTSIEAVAREVVRRSRVQRPSARVLATYLGKPSVGAWLAKHPAHAKALSDITGLPTSAFAGPGAAISFAPLLKRPFDPRNEAVPDIVKVAPLDLMRHRGLKVMQVPSGCGHHFWTEVIRGLAAATVFDQVPLADDVIARSASGAVLVSVETLADDPETEKRLFRLAHLARPVLVLATEIASSVQRALREAKRSANKDAAAEQSGVPEYFRALVARHAREGQGPIGDVEITQLKLNPDWRETLTRWLCARAREEKPKTLSVETALQWLQARDPGGHTVSTPRDLIDILSLLELYPAPRWGGLSGERLADDEDVDPTAIFGLLVKRSVSEARARSFLRQMVQVAQLRAEQVALPLAGPMSSEAWKQLSTEFEQLRELSLFRKTKSWQYAAWPEVLLVEDAKAHLRTLVHDDVDAGTSPPWGLLCLERERRAVIQEELLRCKLRALERVVRVVNQAPLDELRTVAAQDVLFSVVAGRAERGERIDAALAHALARRASSTWVKRYSAQDLPPAPVTRAGPESGGNDADFIADCVVWSLHWMRPDFPFPPGLFPGWEERSWADLPAWWSHFSRGHGVGVERLAKLCGELVAQKRYSGRADLAVLPPLFLPYFVRQLLPKSAAAQTLLSRPGELKAASEIDAVQAWRLALATGISSGIGWMETAGVEPGSAFAAALDELPREALETVGLHGLPPSTWYLLIPALFKDPKRQNDAIEAVQRLVFNEHMMAAEGNALGEQPATFAVSERLLSLMELGVCDCAAAYAEQAARLLWLNAPPRARRHLERELDQRTGQALRWLGGAPPEASADALAALKGRKIDDEIRRWLLRELLRNPAVAEQAWEALMAAERHDSEQDAVVHS